MATRTRQLTFDLRSAPRWGGRRDGAGRKPGPSRRDPHRPRPILAARFPCHVTLKVRRDVPSLRVALFVRALERSWREACERGRFRVAHYSIQRDHVHAIVEAASSADLASGMKSIAARLARAANRVFARRGPVLADRYHLHLLRTPREVRRALAYVLLNSRRHAAKLGRLLRGPARLDPASSGRWFDGWRGGRGPDPPGPAPVAKPRTWLLAVGWRRHGLVDPEEVPGGLIPRNGCVTGFPRTPAPGIESRGRQTDESRSRADRKSGRRRTVGGIGEVGPQYLDIQLPVPTALQEVPQFPRALRSSGTKPAIAPVAS